MLRRSSLEMAELLVTGFSQFSGVAENPTQWLVEHLPEYLEARGEASLVASCAVLRVSAKDTEDFVATTLKRELRHKHHHKTRILVNFGVNVNGACFHLESRAYNCADFRCPDVDGWQPQHQVIEKQEGLTIESFRSCRLPLDDIAERLCSAGHDVKVSTDAGRYICNWIYYHSLMAQDEKKAGAEQNGSAAPWLSLFVHVPPFELIPREKQMTFAADLLSDLQRCCSGNTVAGWPS